VHLVLNVVESIALLIVLGATIVTCLKVWELFRGSGRRDRD
jgi:hypothetical protein